jgi:4-amino-4-deoxy-L-arabinose transferase-like glycosyltransferase
MPAYSATAGKRIPATSQNITSPERFLSDWLIVILIFVLSALYLSPFHSYTLLNADEGIILQGAERILEGQVLYRDFFSFLTPGSYYWMALFFHMFGSSMAVARTVLLVEGALLAVLTYVLSRRVCSRWSSFFAAMLVTLTALPSRFLILHNWDSTLWACLTLYCAVLFVQTSRRLPLFGVGFFAAVTCLFEQSKGAGIVGGLVLAASVYAATRPKSLLRWRPNFLIVTLAGFAIPFLATALYFGTHLSLFPMVDGWLWPVHHYSAVNRTSYGFVVLSPEDRASLYAEPWPARLVTIILSGPWFIVPLLPFIAIVALAYFAWKRRGADNGDRAAYDILIPATVVGLLLAILATGRPDFTHLIYVSPILYVIFAWIADGYIVPLKLRMAVPLINFGMLVTFLGFALALLSQPLNAGHVVETRKGRLKAVQSDEVVNYIQAHVPAGQTTLVYPYLPLYYYLTATSGPGRYEYLMPGFHTPAQFEEFLEAVRAEQPQIVFVEPSFRQKLAAAFPAAVGGTLNDRDIVGEYIAANYRKCTDLNSQQFWHFIAMVKNDLPCPDR